MRPDETIGGGPSADAGRGRKRREDPPDLARLFARDSGAWNAFVDGHAALILSAVQMVLARHGMAEAEFARDLTQDVFVKLIKDDFRLLRRFDVARAGLGTYLVVIARSHTLDALKRRRLPTDPLPDEIGSVAPVELPREDLLESLPQGLLSPRQQEVVELLYYEELSVSEAAVLLGIEEQTVRSQKHRAIKKLREFFADRQEVPTHEG